jgi:DNA processing protein
MGNQINGRDILTFLALKYEGDWNKIYEAIKNKELVDSVTLKETIRTLKSKVCLIIDEDYPEALKKSYKPPFALFYYGDLSSLTRNRQITMLSHSNPTTKLSKTLNQFAESLSKKYGIVTIFNQGVNNSIADSANTKKLVVIGTNGIDSLQVQMNPAKASLIMSEYPGHYIGTESDVAWAVRIASSIGEKLIVSKPDEKSYIGIAVGYSLYLDKQVITLHKSTANNEEGNFVEVRNYTEVDAMMEESGWVKI